MHVFDGAETSKKILGKIGSWQHESWIDVLVNGVNLSVLDNLKTSTNDAEIGLFDFGNDPQSFMSFKQKIKYCIGNNIKIYFSHAIGKDDKERALDDMNEISTRWWKVIVQLPVDDTDVLDQIHLLPSDVDIDNLQWEFGRYWCTQSAIMWLTSYLMDDYAINNIVIIWAEWFIWKWVEEWLTNTYQGLNIQWLDKQYWCSEPEASDHLSNADLIISTASTPVMLPDNIKQWVSMIDCGFIRWELWIRWSIPMSTPLMKKYEFITPVPGWMGPFGMLFMISKLKGVSDSDMARHIQNNIVTAELQT